MRMIEPVMADHPKCRPLTIALSDGRVVPSCCEALQCPNGTAGLVRELTQQGTGGVEGGQGISRRRRNRSLNRESLRKVSIRGSTFR